MKVFEYLVLLITVLGLYSVSSHAGRYVNGVEGIKASSVPGSGLYFRSYNLLYQAEDLVDSNGDSLDVGFDLSVSASANRLIWVTDYQLAGGNYFADVVIPLVRIDLQLSSLSVDGKESKVGDIYLEPFGLAWHGSRWEAAAAIGVYLDNGDYSADNPVNIGAGYRSYMFTLGTTQYFLDQNKLSLSVLARYETHQQQNETKIEHGDDVHFEYGLGYSLSPTFDIGLAGYYETQVSNDEGDLATEEKRYVFAIGPEVAKAFPDHKWLVSFRALTEIDAENGSKGSLANLTITKIF